MKQKSFWIKERHNPQLGVYYVGCGQLSRREALAMENTLYGTNIMREYTETEYKAAVEQLRKQNPEGN